MLNQVDLTLSLDKETYKRELLRHNWRSTIWGIRLTCSSVLW